MEDKIVRQIGIHTTNSTDKRFICPNNAGISTCGDVSLSGKPISGLCKLPNVKRSQELSYMLVPDSPNQKTIICCLPVFCGGGLKK